MLTFLLIVYAILAGLAGGIVVAAVADERGRTRWKWILVAVFATPLVALLGLIAMPESRALPPLRDLSS
jgi:hypothetical protein